MSDTYTKLFSSITESTVWGEAYATRIVWVTMLAMADARGHVYGAVPGLARRANVTLAEVETALAAFSAPDTYSRSKDDDGRRVESIDGGWRLINHGKYSAVRNADERREYKREWDRKHRSKSDEASDTKSDKSDTNPMNPASAATPALAPALVKQDQKQKQPSASPSALPDPPDWIDVDAWKGFVAMRVKERHPLTPRAATLIIKSLTKFHADGHDHAAILDQSTRNGWRDVFAIKPDKGFTNEKPHARLSAAERVRANAIAGERADRARADRNADAVGSHGRDIRPPLD